MLRSKISRPPVLSGLVLRALIATLALLALALLAAEASRAQAVPPSIVIDSPVHGAWGPPTEVRGSVLGAAAGTAYVVVNDFLAPFDPATGVFSLPWALIAPDFPEAHVFHPVLAELRATADDRILARDRVVVHNMDEYDASTLWRYDPDLRAVSAHLNAPFFPDMSVAVSRVLSAELGSDHPDGAVNLLELDDEDAEAGALFLPICVSMDAKTVSLLGALAIAIPPKVTGAGAVAPQFCVFEARARLEEARLDGTTSVSLSPAAGSVGIVLDASKVGVVADVDLHGFFSVGPINGPSFWFDACKATGSTGPASLTGSLGFAPHPDNPIFLNVIPRGDMVASISGLSIDYGALCGAPIIEQAIQIMKGPIANAAERIVENSLNDRQNGDTAISEALETALLEVPIAGQVIRRTGSLQVAAPIDRVRETIDGVTVSLDVLVHSPTDVPEAPSPFESFYVEGTPPVYEARTPGGLDYEAAASVHTGALNQSLAAATRIGVFNYTGGEVDLSALGDCVPDPADPTSCLSGVFPIDSTFLASFVPAFAGLPAGTPLELVVEPTLSPVVAMNPDPSASDPSPLHAHAAQHLVSVIEPLPTGDKLWLQVAIDLRAGLSAEAGAIPGHLDVGIESSLGGYFPGVVSLAHAFSAWPDDAALSLLLNLLAAVYVVPELVETLETDPLPTVDLPAITELPHMQPTLFDVVPVETEIAEDFVTVFMDMELLE